MCDRKPYQFARWVSLCSFILIVNLFAAQQLAGGKVVFDTISIHRDKDEGFPQVWDEPKSDELKFTGTTVEGLIYYAFDLPSADLLSGVPGWAKTERYVVDAKVADVDVDAFQRLDRTQKRIMLRGVLADRFHLVSETQGKMVQGYVLTRGKKPLLQAVPANRENLARLPDGAITSGGPGKLGGEEITMARFARSLTGVLGRPVVDETGLSGVYTFKIHWDPHWTKTLPVNEASTQRVDSGEPTPEQAVEEQLGLQLKIRPLKMEALVVKSVERPSAN